MTDDEVVETVLAAALTRTLPPPAEPDAIAEAEQVIGYRTPEDLADSQ